MKPINESVFDILNHIRAMKNSVESVLKEFEIENPHITLCIMGSVLPYMMAFNYSDNDSTGEQK